MGDVEAMTLTPESPEQMLIACCIESPEVVDGLKEGLFGGDKELAVFRILAGLRTTRKSWQPAEALLEVWKDNPGLLAPVNDWLNALPSPAGWPYWEAECRERAVMRHAGKVAFDIERGVETGDVDLEGWAKQLQLIEKARNRTPTAQMRQLVGNTLGIMEERYQMTTPWAGVSTGIARLNLLAEGLLPKCMWIIAARPSEGKTTLGLCMALHVALEERTPAAYFTIEMSAEMLVQKAIFSRSNVSQTTWKRQALSEHDFGRLNAASLELSNSCLHIIDSAITFQQIATTLRKLVSESGVKVAIVDYLGLVSYEGERDKWLSVARVSNGLQRLAMELAISIVALAQLNRDSEKNEREPRLSDLKGSGEIEQDATTVVFIHHKPKSKLIVAKARFGSPGEVPITCDFDRGVITEDQA